MTPSPPRPPSMREIQALALAVGKLAENVHNMAEAMALYQQATSSKLAQVEKRLNTLELKIPAIH